MAKKENDEKEVQVYSNMIYCPECGAIQSRKENFCSQCGANLHENKEKSKEKKETGENLEKKADEKKVPFYKNKVFLFFAGFFLLTLLIVGSIVFLKMNEANSFKKSVLDAWKDIKTESTEINSKVNEMSKMEDFASTAVLIKDSENVISEKKDIINKIDTPSYYEDGKNELVKGIDDLVGYLQELRSQADNPSNMTDQDIKDLEKLGEDTKTQLSKAYAKLNFINEKVPEDIYGAVAKFEDVRENFEKQLADEEQQKAETERASQEQQEAKAKAESTVTSFMNAYIAGNENEIKKYMTSAFQKEFNYADLSADARLYSYPESFRITTTKITSDSQYDIYGRELQVNRDSGSKWTINRHFAVLFSASENKWLIDRWDISTE